MFRPNNSCFRFTLTHIRAIKRCRFKNTRRRCIWLSHQNKAITKSPWRVARNNSLCVLLLVARRPRALLHPSTLKQRTQAKKKTLISQPKITQLGSHLMNSGVYLRIFFCGRVALPVSTPEIRGSFWTKKKKGEEAVNCLTKIKLLILIVVHSFPLTQCPHENVNCLSTMAQISNGRK